MDDGVLSWLHEQEPAVRFQVERDLAGRHDHEFQEQIGRTGPGAMMLAARGPHGHWGRGFYQPKWTSSHYTLLELKNMGLSRSEPVAGEVVARILAESKRPQGGLRPAKTVDDGDACVDGMALGYATYFGAPQEHLISIVDYLLGQRLADGGFNCERERSGATHSSVHTTVCVLEGITEYVRRGYDHRVADLVDARASSVEFLLRHRMFRSERTGAPITPELTRLHHPTRWHYDVLRGLDALADAGVPHDPRMDDALDLVAARRRADGRWAAHRPYPGVTHVPPIPAGASSPWITLIAMRVLQQYRPG